MYLSKDSEVFFEVGESLRKQEFGARTPSRAEVAERGRKWLESRRREICQIITGEKLKTALKGGTPEEEQMRIIADLLAAHALGVPPFVLARAIVTLGSHWFCGD